MQERIVFVDIVSYLLFINRLNLRVEKRLLISIQASKKLMRTRMMMMMMMMKMMKMMMT